MSDPFISRTCQLRFSFLGAEGTAPPGIHLGRFPDRAPLRRDGARSCPLAQARPHDGRRRDRDKRAGQRLGLHGAPAGRRGHLKQNEIAGRTGPNRSSNGQCSHIGGLWNTARARGRYSAALMLAARITMDKLLFWLGIGAAQKSAGSKPTDNRHPVTSFVVGILLAPVIVAGAFILLVSQQ